MKKVKLLPSILMLVMCIAVLGVGIYAVAPSTNAVTGSITIKGMSLNVDVEAWVVGNEDNIKTPSEVSGIKTISFENLSMDLSTINYLTDANITIAIKVINKSSAMEIGAYFLKIGATLKEVAVMDDVLTSDSIKDPNDSTKTLINTRIDFYKHVGKASDNASDTSDEAILYINLSPADWIEDDYNDGSVQFSYTLVIEKYNANITTETYDMSTATTGSILRVSSSYTKNEEIVERAEITASTFANGSTTAVSNLGVVLPVGITKITGNSFNNFVALSAISFPHTLTSIASAFTGCSNLKTINIPTNIETLDTGSFGANLHLDAYVLIDGIKYLTNEYGKPYLLADGTQFAKTSLTDFPQSCKYILSNAFINNTIIQYVTMPDYIIGLGAHAFDGCTSLVSITLSNNITNIGVQTFQNCSSLKSLVIPASVNTIGMYAFKDCASLSSVTLNGCKQLSAGSSGLFSSMIQEVIVKAGTTLAPNVFTGVANPITLPTSVPSGYVVVTDWNIPKIAVAHDQDTRYYRTIALSA